MTTAPRGAAIVSLCDQRREQRLHTRPSAPNQLTRNLDRLRAYRRAVCAWDEADGRYRLPQPGDFGLEIPNLRPSHVLLDDSA
jgi:hypothetical protein